MGCVRMLYCSLILVYVCTEKHVREKGRGDVLRVPAFTGDLLGAEEPALVVFPVLLVGTLADAGRFGGLRL